MYTSGNTWRWTWWSWGLRSINRFCRIRWECDRPQSFAAELYTSVWSNHRRLWPFHTTILWVFEYCRTFFSRKRKEIFAFHFIEEIEFVTQHYYSREKTSVYLVGKLWICTSWCYTELRHNYLWYLAYLRLLRHRFAFNNHDSYWWGNHISWKTTIRNTQGIPKESCKKCAVLTS
jgi:hypothetical protein